MIRSTFQAFETAKRALSISQAGLDTVGHNISNAQTAGYTRQRVDQVSVSMGGMHSKYQIFGQTSTGAGTNLQGINQIRDVYLDNRFRAEASVNGELTIKADGLTDVVNILDEISSDGLHSKMSDLKNVLNLLGRDADNPDLATIVRDTAREMTQIINKNAKQLESARAEQKVNLNATVDEKINGMLEKIASLNKKIQEDNTYGNPSNELNDARNMLIDQLSEYADIKVVRSPLKVSPELTIDKLSIELKDSGYPPVTLVDAGEFNQLGVTENADGSVSIGLIDGISKLPMDIDVGNILLSGQHSGGLKGYLDVINGKGPQLGEATNETYRGIPFYQKALDEYAVQLASVFNRINNITAAEAADSGSTHTPVVEGEAAKWMTQVTSGSLNFSGKSTNMQFEFDGTNVTAKMTDETGTEKTYTATYVANGEMSFMDGGSVAFKAVTNATAPPPTSNGVINAGSPPSLKPTSDKNLFVPLIPKVTDTATGKTPTWLDTIKGGSIQFAGKDYPVKFSYDSSDPTKISATMTDENGVSQVFTATYEANSQIKFLDNDKGVAFSVNTTGTPPQNGTTDVNIDANINANNISISQNWLDSAKYITASKKNPVAATKTELELVGSSKPNWLNSVAYGKDKVGITDGTYKFKVGTSGTDKTISVTIAGIEYTGVYQPNKSIDLKGGVPEVVGLTISTNAKALDAAGTEVAATIKNTTGAKSDNINKFATEMDAERNYSVAGITGGFQQYLVTLQGQMGLDQSQNTSTLSSSNLVVGAFADRRDAISAVSIDEEGINMMTYQNYYNAAARYMTTIDEALDKVINGMGTVGR